MIKGPGTDDQPYEIDEFSGGITDDYIEGPKNAAQYMENLVLTANRRMTSRPGITYFVDEQVNSSATRIHVFNHFDEPLVLQGRRAFKKTNATDWGQIYGPNNGGSTDPAVSNTSASATSIFSSASWKGHTYFTTDDISQPDKVYKDGSTWKTRTAGLPIPASLSAVSSAVGSTTSYIYALVFKHSYTAGLETFVKYSAPTLVTLTSASAIGVSTTTVTLPQFTGFGLNYDTTVITQELYRTINGGTDFYLVESTTYNDTSITDTMTDATLLTQEALYINGGIADNDLPPKCKFIHIMGDTAYYAYLKDGSGTYPYLIRQSNQGDPESVPDENNLELKSAITGISSHHGRLLAFTSDEINRIEGSINIFGQGALEPVQISPDAGCIAHNSIVQTPYGVVWFGNNGVYHTEGYTVTKISPHLNETYEGLVSTADKRSRVQGTYHADLQCVMWTVGRDSITENDAIFILDLRWGIRPGALDVKQTTATFYFWDCDAVSNIRWCNRQLLLGHASGYLHYATSTETQDIKFGVTGDPSTWEAQTIFYNWTSTATNFGTHFMRKWVTWFAVSSTSLSNLSLGLTSIVDDGKTVAALKPIRHRGHIIWGITEVFWGDEGYLWNRSGTADYKRRIPKNSLRCMHRQIELSNAKVVILGAEVMGTVLVNASAKTAVLSGSLTWPSQFVDYTISFPNDDYVREFTITTVSTNTIIFSDSGNFCPATGSYLFVVRGYPKGETLSINALQMWYQPISKTQKAFATSQTGEP